MQNTILIQENNQIIRLHYTLVLSNRKSLGIEIKPGGEIIVRAPKRATKHWIASCLEEKKEWIYKSYLNQKTKSVPTNEQDSPRDQRHLSLRMLLKKKKKKKREREREGFLVTSN